MLINKSGCGCCCFAEPWPSNVVAAPTAMARGELLVRGVGSRLSQERASTTQMVTQGRPQCVPKWQAFKQAPATSIGAMLDAWLGSSGGASHDPDSASWVPHTPTVGAVAFSDSDQQSQWLLRC